MSEEITIIKEQVWRDSSLRARNLGVYLTDKEFAKARYRLFPIKDYILKSYPQGAFDASDPANKVYVRRYGKFHFLGSKSTAPAIELSQWGYYVTLVVTTKAERKQARKDARVQAGLFKDILVMDYLKDVIPKGSIIIVVDPFSHIKSYKKVKAILDRWLSNHNEVVCALPRDRDWWKILKPDFSISKIGRMTINDIFLSITRK